MSAKHISISGMGLFTMDFNFSFIVSYLINKVTHMNWNIYSMLKKFINVKLGLCFQFTSMTITYFLIVLGLP